MPSIQVRHQFDGPVATCLLHARNYEMQNIAFKLLFSAKHYLETNKTLQMNAVASRAPFSQSSCYMMEINDVLFFNIVNIF